MHIKDFNHVLAIICTTSSNYNEVKNLLIDHLSKYRKEYEIILTEDEYTTINEAKRFANENINSLLIVVGGDGSLSESVNGIALSDNFITIVPNGTGNDAYRSIYKENKGLHENIKKLINFEIIDVDLTRVNDEYMFNSLSFGFESVVLDKSLKIKPYLGKLKSLSFVLAIFPSFKHLKAYNYEYEFVLFNDAVIKGSQKRLVTAILNGKYFGGGFLPAPNAKINDGLLNLNSIKPLGIIKVLKALPKYKDGSHINLEVSENYTLKSGKIKSLDGEMYAEIDGNPRMYEEIEFEILNEKIKFAKSI